MENAIKLNYDIEFLSYKQDNDITILTDKDSTYYFVICPRDIKEMKDVYEVSLEMLKRGIAIHNFIINKNGQILTTIEEKNYCLLKINFMETVEFNLSDINKFNKITVLAGEKNNLYRNDWSNLWSSKIDYFEYQISELGRGKRIILNSFGYYIGLAENAISYVNFTNKNVTKNNEEIVLNRKRIYYPNYSINYLNPLAFIFDLKVRDMAEYIKASFFNGKEIWSELDNYFKHEKLTPYEAHMLYARLLYPSYYFDIYERIMNNDEDEEQLIKIIDKCEEYEDFLQDIYYYLSNFTPMYKVDWLIKKDVIEEH